MKNGVLIFSNNNRGCSKYIGRFIILFAVFFLFIGLCLGVLVWHSLANTKVSVPVSADDLVIFGDELAEGWYDNSYNDTWINFISDTYHSGITGLRIDYGGYWGTMRLQNDQLIDIDTYQAVSFWVKLPWSDSPNLHVSLMGEEINSPSVEISVNRGAWQQVIIPLEEFDPPRKIKGVVMQNVSGENGQFATVDDIRLLRNKGDIASAPPKVYSVRVDLASTKRPISPDIYGINFVDTEFSAEVSIPVVRWGGNATSRYNYEADVSNRASDWFYENISNPVEDESKLPFGSASNNFVIDHHANNTDVIMTMPLLGWIPKSRDFSCGFPLSVYPNQQYSEHNRKFPCGNGHYPDGSPIVGNDPELSSKAIDPTYVTNWINHLTSQFGLAKDGGVRFYSLDNEPMLWNVTHRDIHPNPTTYDELLERTLEYAPVIKAADPTAQTLGPAVWGWMAYFYSAADLTKGKIRDAKDQAAHGDMPLLPWYMQQLSQYEQANGVRLLDYLDIHYYPPFDTKVPLSTAGNRDIMGLRMRATRSLWDRSYDDESWIGEPVYLIPRMHDWINQYYPDTKLAITEYNFGGLEHINGAVAQADALGIFGREGVDLATLWDPEGNDDPWSFAFRMFRNYDGQGSQFGDMGFPVFSPNPDELSVFAAERTADNVLTVIVVNKSWQPQEISMNFASGTRSDSIKTYRYSNADWDNIIAGETTFSRANLLAETYPAQSITLLEIR